MGYETKIFVCAEFGWIGEKYRHGELLAMIDLCKCGYEESAVGRLIAKHTKTANEEKTKKWCLHGFSSDRENEVFRFLESIDKFDDLLYTEQEFKELLDEFEENNVTWHDKSLLKVVTYGH